MNESRVIVTTYNKDGTVKIEPKGFPGQLCHKATAPYEKKLGIVSTQPTDEVYQEEPLKEQTDKLFE